jgi:hypothetical protein
MVVATKILMIWLSVSQSKRETLQSTCRGALHGYPQISANIFVLVQNVSKSNMLQNTPINQLNQAGLMGYFFEYSLPI